MSKRNFTHCPTVTSWCPLPSVPCRLLGPSQLATGFASDKRTPPPRQTAKPPWLHHHPISRFFMLFRKSMTLNICFQVHQLAGCQTVPSSPTSPVGKAHGQPDHLEGEIPGDSRHARKWRRPQYQFLPHRFQVLEPPHHGERPSSCHRPRMLSTCAAGQGAPAGARQLRHRRAEPPGCETPHQGGEASPCGGTAFALDSEGRRNGKLTRS